MHVESHPVARGSGGGHNFGHVYTSSLLLRFAPSVRKVPPSSCGRWSRYFGMNCPESWNTKSDPYNTASAVSLFPQSLIQVASPILVKQITLTDRSTSHAQSARRT